MQKLKFIFLLLAFPLLGFTCTSRNDTEAEPPSGGMYRSTDGGETWEQKVTFEDGRHIASVAPLHVKIDPNDSQTIYVATGETGLIRTGDRGDTWSRVEHDPIFVTHIGIYPTDSQYLYIAGVPEGKTRGRIWASPDSGSFWKEIYSEPIGEQTRMLGGSRVEPGTVTALEISSLMPDHVFTGSSIGALTASFDGGLTWTQRHEFRQPITGLQLSQIDSHIMYVRLGDGSLVRSEDAGETFSDISVSVSTFQKASIFSLIEMQQENELVLFAGTDRGLYRSDDNGSTWERVPLPVTEAPPVRITALDVSVDGAIWAGSVNNLYSSRDGGFSWTVDQFDFPNSIRYIKTDPTNADIVYTFFLPL